MSGGILLVACVLNENQQIQIVSVTIVSIENEANFSLFLRNLGVILPVKPTFILPDRKRDDSCCQLCVSQHISLLLLSPFDGDSTGRFDLLNRIMNHEG